MSTPCFIITRDRVSYLKRCLQSLESSHLDIHIVDHGSSWEPMLQFLEQAPHPVHRYEDRPPRALWDDDLLKRIVGERRRYLVTDPDVVLDDACPEDWLSWLESWLESEPGYIKAGLGLRIDDLPPGPLSSNIKAWEGAFWEAPVHLASTLSGIYRAPVDTTLALYQPLSVQSWFSLTLAMRLGSPYLLRHLPWYGDLDSDETEYYRRHLVPGSSHWANGGW